jgi:hypothetical protein
MRQDLRRSRCGCRVLSDGTGYDHWSVELRDRGTKIPGSFGDPGRASMKGKGEFIAPHQGNTARDQADVQRRHRYGCACCNSPSGCLLSVLAGSWPGRFTLPDRSMAIRVHIWHVSDSRGEPFDCQPPIEAIFDNRSTRASLPVLGHHGAEATGDGEWRGSRGAVMGRGNRGAAMGEGRGDRGSGGGRGWCQARWFCGWGDASRRARRVARSG